MITNPVNSVTRCASQANGSEVEEVRASIVAALDRLFARKEGQALARLLADAVAGAIPSLATATQDWCDDIRAVIVLRLRADEPGTDLDIADAAARFLAPEFDALAEELFTAALGRGLLHLPKFALPEVAEERVSGLNHNSIRTSPVLDLQEACHLEQGLSGGQ